MDVLSVLASTGEVLSATGASFYGGGRPADKLPVRSLVPVRVRFYDDNGNRTLLPAATGAGVFTAQPAVNDLFVVGAQTYKIVATVAAAGDVKLGAALADTVANLAGAINAATTGGQAVGTTYGTGTTGNALVRAAAFGTAVLITALLADASGNSIATTTTCAHASFGGATLSGASVLHLDIKPTGEYDADFTIASPAFTAPADPATGDYTGLLDTNVIEAIALLEPANPGKGILTFTAQPAANDVFTVGAVTYKAVTVLTGAADEVLRGTSLSAFLSNLIGAVNAATTGGQAAGTTYGTGTVANDLATAAPGTAPSTILFTATSAGCVVPVATSTISTAASFGAAFLAAGQSTAPEPDAVPLMAQLSWGLPGVPPQRSDECALNLTNCIRHDGEGAPASAAQYYTTDQVLAAIAQAAAADTPAARNAAITAALAGFTPLDTSAAVLQPPGVSLAYAHRLGLVNPLPGGITLDLSDKGLTSITPSEVLGWIIAAANLLLSVGYGNAPINVRLGSNALTNTDQILDYIAAGMSGPTLTGTSWYGVLNIDLSGGTNTAPTAGTMHEDASLSLQLPAPVPANAGLAYSITLNADTTPATTSVTYDATIPLNASSYSQSGNGGNGGYSFAAVLGVQDSPAMSDAVAKISDLFSGSPVSYFTSSQGAFINPDGSFGGTDPVDADYPVAFAGPAITDSAPGVAAVPNASIAAIRTLNNDTGQAETN